MMLIERYWRKHGRITVISLLVIGSLFVGACGEKEETKTLESEFRLSEEQTYDEWMDSVVQVWVVAHSHNWDSDAEDDGIRIWIELLDENEEIIYYQNQQIDVTLEIYATESVIIPWEPSRLIYSSSTVLHNWIDDAFVTGNTGVKDIAWEEISPPLLSEQQEYGLLYITTTLSNGNKYSARYDETRISN